jgi:hypothetical protein
VRIGDRAYRLQPHQLGFRESGNSFMSVPLHIYRWFIFAAVTLTACAPIACVRGQKATDTGDPGLPFGPAAVRIQAIAYVQDIKPIFDRDCLSCHNSRDARGNYSVSSYTDSVAGQRPGDASSSVVVDCSPGGSMYRYFSGDAAAEATLVFRWLVVYDGAQTR